jgi:CheY-like chemotaxis protein
MDIIKVLLVEDAEDQQNIFKSSVEVFNHKNSDAYTVEYVLASNLDEAVTKIDGSFDGAILDLKLDQDDEGGNKVVAKLDESLIRIPVIFVTGHPELVAQHKRIVKTRPRASESYESDIELIRDIKCTGLTHIMGGRGKIEETLHHVFTHNLLPQITTWMEYGKIDSKQTEMALLRHTLNHLLQLLDDDLDLSYAEEVYISPPLSDAIKTGSILKKKDETPLFVVMNPACDLVLRADGKFKTDHVLLVEIDLEDLT